MRKPLQNIGASVRARLLNLAKERNQPFELLLVRYTLERLLYRLSKSKHRENFVLKGAMLMRHWLDDPLRPTRDLDLHGFGEGDPELTVKIFREICAIKPMTPSSSISTGSSSTGSAKNPDTAACG
jgi:predicted nucleotidyltransferase component of viral defense system